jgi:hypothetical protein
MRIVCPHCGGKAVVSSRKMQTETVFDLYCQCKNVANCAATFVCTLWVKHTIREPITVAVKAAQMEKDFM